MSEKEQENVERLIGLIRSQHPVVVALAQRLRTSEIQAKFNKFDSNSWCVSVAGDALIRIRLLIEQNFNYVETLGLVAVARYILELTIWLRLFKRDPRYGLVYYDQLLKTQQQHHADTKAQFEREVALLDAFATRVKESQNKVWEKIKGLSLAEVEDLAPLAQLKSINEEIDGEASRLFSIYAEKARTIGYGTLAFLVGKNLTDVSKAIDDIATERRALELTLSQETKVLIPRRWQWRAMAQEVGMTDQYDYVYSFSSRLLHATPASITTDNKNLALTEMEVFLKYVHVTIEDVMALAEEYC